MEECDEALKNLSVPVGYCFGSEDPLLDWLVQKLTGTGTNAAE